MSKVLSINEQDKIVIVGMDDNTLQEYPMTAFDFFPQVNDIVDVYKSDEKVQIHKRETVNQNTNTNAQGVQVNIINNVPVGAKCVNKLCYCLLALFLGAFGIHKFYAGKTTAGVLYLLFFWTCIPEVLSFIDFIQGLCKPSDINGNFYL